MRQILLEGGWPIIPVILFGLTASALAISHAFSPNHARMPLILGLGVATLLFGVLGTALGSQLSFAAAAREPHGGAALAMQGLKESLYDLTVASGFAVAATVAATIGSFRLGLSRLT